MLVLEAARRKAEFSVVARQSVLGVDLWSSTGFNYGESLDPLRENLSRDEIFRADALVFESDRRDFIAGRQFLRLVLSAYTDIPPKDIQFCFGVAGKPEMRRFSGAFNLSHSGGVATVAVTRVRGISLGVDIEAIREIDRDVPKHCFSKTEQKILYGKSDSVWLESFYRIWTRKEAIVKCFGTGLDDDMNKFDTMSWCGEPKARAKVCIDGNEKTVHLHEFEPIPGFVGAIAVEAHPELE